MEENKDVIIKYSSYTEAQKRATKKYRENNKDKVNEQRKKYYQKRKEEDPNFLNYKREKAKEYYKKKKESKVDIPVPIEIKEIDKEIEELEKLKEENFKKIQVTPLLKHTYENIIVGLNEEIKNLKDKKEEPKKEHLDINKLTSIFSATELGRLIDEAIEEKAQLYETKQEKEIRRDNNKNVI